MKRVTECPKCEEARRNAFLEVADMIGEPEWCGQDHAVAGGMCLFMDKSASSPEFTEALRRMKQLRRMLADDIRESVGVLAKQPAVGDLVE